MIANPVELEMQRRMTHAFIQADPVEIVLWRQTKVPNGSGGFVLGPPTSLPSQTFKAIPQNHQLEERQTTDGVMVRPDSVLIGHWDANIVRGDWFVDVEGNRFDVVYVGEKRDYETRAELTYRG